MAMTLDEKLERLAMVAVRVGLGMEAGKTPPQQVLISAPLEAAPLVRKIVEQSYKAGATLVTPLFSDDECVLARYKLAADASFDQTNEWMAEGVHKAFQQNTARLAIAGGNPALLAGQDPGKIARANKAGSIAMKPAMEMITRHDINWNIVAAATPAWAKLMFPKDSEEEGVAKLWEAIFAASRVLGADPVAEWKRHSDGLQKKTAFLNERNYKSLRYRGPGTELELGLSDGHKWLGGGCIAGNGIPCMPNIPTEEVFTTPHRERAEGKVRSTKPLSHQGTLIRDIEVKFAGGKIVEAHASEGEEALRRLLDTDEGARRLGEVALVPHSSPISASGLMFYNTLFDENAASHIALGQAYSTCLHGGDTMSKEELAKRGANESLIHVDWMIGSGEVDIDGVTQTGAVEPLMRKGEWC